MEPAQLGYFVGQFAMSLLFAAVWLLVSKAMASLRRRPGVSYGVAVVFAFIPPLVTIDGSSVDGIVAALLCSVLLFWQYKRAKAKLLSKQAKANVPPGS